MRAVFIMIVILFLNSCTGDKCRNTSVSGEPTTIKVDRLEIALFNAQSPEEIRAILESRKSFSDLFLDAQQYPDYAILAERIFQLTNDDFIDTLFMEANIAFGDLSVLEDDLNQAIGRMRSIFPEMTIPKLQTAVTGLYKDLYVSDSLIIIGLDYFIGPKATYRPMDIPQYILIRYDPEHLPTTVIKFLSGPYVSKGKNETLISEMIDFGKSFYLLSQLMPCTPDSLLMEYSPKEMNTVEENQAIIWANFIENEVLYETSHIIKRKFLGERPNVYEISEECPGRIGAWIGWQIVKAYMENNQVELIDLIKERDNDKIFRLSAYKPKG